MDTPAERHSTKKLVTLILLPAVASITYHGVLAAVLSQGLRDRWWLIAIGFLAFCATYALAGICGAIVRQRWTSLAVASLVSISAFVVGLSLTVIIGIFLEFIAVLSLVHSAKHETETRIPFSIAKSLIGATASLVIAVLAIAFLSYDGLSRHATTGALQSAVVEGTVTALNRSLPLVYHEFQPSMTVNEFLQSQLPNVDELFNDIRPGLPVASQRKAIENRLRDAGIDPASIDLDRILATGVQQDAEILRQIKIKLHEVNAAVVESTRLRLSEMFDLPLDGNEKLDGALRRIIRHRFDRLTVPHVRFLPLIATASLFFTMALFTSVYTLLVWGIAIAVFWLMAQTHFVRRAERSTTVVRYQL